MLNLKLKNLAFGWRTYWCK